MNQKALFYTTLTGRRLDLSMVSGELRPFLRSALGNYRKRLTWNDFSRRWREEARRMGLTSASMVCQVCEDLEGRLAVSQGHMAPPNWTDILIDTVQRGFGGREAFCQQKPITLSLFDNVIRARHDLSLAEIGKVLEVAGLVLWAIPKSQADAFLADVPTELDAALQE